MITELEDLLVDFSEFDFQHILGELQSILHSKELSWWAGNFEYHSFNRLDYLDKIIATGFPGLVGWLWFLRHDKRLSSEIVTAYLCLAGLDIGFERLDRKLQDDNDDSVLERLLDSDDFNFLLCRDPRALPIFQSFWKRQGCPWLEYDYRLYLDDSDKAAGTFQGGQDFFNSYQWRRKTYFEACNTIEYKVEKEHRRIQSLDPVTLNKCFLEPKQEVISILNHFKNLAESSDEIIDLRGSSYTMSFLVQLSPYLLTPNGYKFIFDELISIEDLGNKIITDCFLGLESGFHVLDLLLREGQVTVDQFTLSHERDFRWILDDVFRCRHPKIAEIFSDNLRYSHPTSSKLLEEYNVKRSAFLETSRTCGLYKANWLKEHEAVKYTQR